ncbi:hypothetical protein [Caulobacter segnis]|uniref:hypothetical protein n=1 Tax=Caulobacter segnis TaxID=88688 RepID=UPI002858FDE8|nr:hypothetical protein [Caulobacter segnis]MDR6624852.1 hypothetical protein [Caulobacter segnis]
MQTSCPRTVRTGLRLAVLAAMAVTLVACSDKPSSSQARRAFDEQLKSRLGATPYRIQRFEKTNGQIQSVYGTEFYVVSYKATVTFPQGIRPECVSAGGRFVGWNCYNAGLFGLPPQPAGATVKFDSTIPLRKTERGWMRVT